MRCNFQLNINTKQKIHFNFYLQNLLFLKQNVMAIEFQAYHIPHLSERIKVRLPLTQSLYKIVRAKKVWVTTVF